MLCCFAWGFSSAVKKYVPGPIPPGLTTTISGDIQHLVGSVSWRHGLCRRSALFDSDQSRHVQWLHAGTPQNTIMLIHLLRGSEHKYGQPRWALRRYLNGPSYGSGQALESRCYLVGREQSQRTMLNATQVTHRQSCVTLHLPECCQKQLRVLDHESFTMVRALQITWQSESKHSLLKMVQNCTALPSLTISWENAWFSSREVKMQTRQSLQQQTSLIAECLVCAHLNNVQRMSETCC